MPEQLYADARTVIDAARRMAHKSVDAMAAAIRMNHASMQLQGMTRKQADDQCVADAKQRIEVVLDSYLTGAAEILKMLMGDFTPEPWSEDYDHEARLTELLAEYARICPECHRPRSVPQAPEGRERMFCALCGWGKEPNAKPEDHS